MKSSNSVIAALRQLLLEGNTGNQEAICQALEEQGFPVTQSKVSRLLSKIGAIKVTTPQGQISYRLPHEYGLAHELQHAPARLPIQQWVFDILSNGSLIVIHTMPGSAALVAREIDLRRIDLEVLGTIAGDDTIFVAPKDVKQIKQVIDAIKLQLGI